jgi:putative peptidoglycan lipid II flippase
MVSLGGRGIVFLRDLALTHQFGAGRETDAFFLVYNLWVRIGVSLQAAMPKVLLQPYQASQVRGEPEAGRLLWSSLLAALLVGALVAAVTWPLGPSILAFFGRADGPGPTPEAIAIFRLALPLLPACLVAGVVTVLGHARGRFLSMEVASMLLSIGVVFGVVALGPHVGIVGASIGLLAGGLLTAVVLVGWVMRTELPFSLGVAEFRLGLLTLARGFMATTFGYAGGTALGVIQRWFYARLPEGQLSYIEIAWRVSMLPQHLLLASVMTTLLPVLSAATQHPEDGEAHRLILRSARAILSFSLPGAAALGVVAHPLIRGVFEHGEFSSQDATATAALLAWFGVPAVLMTLRGVVLNVFFAYGHFGLAMSLGALDLLVFPAVATLTARYEAHGMIAAQGVTDGLGLILAMYGTWRVTGTPWSSLLPLVLRLSVATLAAAATAAAAVAGVRGQFPEGRGWVDLVSCAAGLLTFAGVFVPAAMALGLEEVRATLWGLAGAARSRFGLGSRGQEP